MRQNSIIYIALLMMAFFASCSSQKKSYKAPIKEEGEDYLLSKMQENETKFQSFSAKALVEVLHNDRVTALNANIRIQKDSLIWVSISAGIGIEAARILLTRDSVFYLNRLDKTYFKGSYQFVNEMIDAEVNFDIIQSLLTGNDFVWYDYQDLKASVSGRNYQLESTHRRKLKKYQRHDESASQVIYQSMWLNPESFKIERIKIKEIKNQNKKIIADYSQFKEKEEQLFPTEYYILISAEQDIEIEASLLKFELNRVKSFPFKISSKYTKIQMK